MRWAEAHGRGRKRAFRILRRVVMKQLSFLPAAEKSAIQVAFLNAVLAAVLHFRFDNVQVVRVVDEDVAFLHEALPTHVVVSNDSDASLFALWCRRDQVVFHARYVGRDLVAVDARAAKARVVSSRFPSVAALGVEKGAWSLAVGEQRTAAEVAAWLSSMLLCTNSRACDFGRKIMVKKDTSRETIFLKVSCAHLCFVLLNEPGELAVFIANFFFSSNSV